MLLLSIVFTVQVPERTRGLDTIDYIMIVDAPNGTGSWVASRNYSFGDSDTFWAAGMNITYGWVQDVSVYWLFNSSGPMTGNRVVRTNNSYGSSVKVFTNGYGITSLRAHGRVAQAGMTNDTGPLRVDVSNVDSVVIRFDQGGMGTWVGDTTYQSGDKDIFYEAAYDSAGDFLGDIVANWSSTNLSVGYLYSSSGRQGCDGSGTSSSCYPLINFYANAIGHAYVNATPVGTSVLNTTGKLTVNGTGIDYVQIRNAPKGNGAVLGEGTYYEREQDTFYAASYNNTYGYRGDVVGDWTSNNSAVCQVHGYSGNSAHGSSVQVIMGTPGVCTVTVNATTISGMVSNITGNLTIRSRTILTVDANGGRDYLKIQDAVDAASDGYTIIVYPATYTEHVVVSKEIEIVGTNRYGVILDGSGNGTALYLSADRIVMHNFTIQNTSYGVFNDQTNNTRLYYMAIHDYEIGVNNSKTLNAWIAYNVVKQGTIGVVAYEAYDDAIRWNEIAYNTKYGGKGYDAHLRNCFNWNNLHNNTIGYYYDPTTDLPPMEFDGNTVTDNVIGVKVENSSAITLTSNMISGGSEGVQLLNSSSKVALNTIKTVKVGVRFVSSSSNIAANTISASDVGISGDGGAPQIEDNNIFVTSGNAMTLANLNGAIIQRNNLQGRTMTILNSRIDVLAAVNSNVILIDSTVRSLSLDTNSRMEVRHTVRIRTVDVNGGGIGGVTVTVRDAKNNLAFSGVTGPDSYTASFMLTTEVRSFGLIEDRNPFVIDVSAGSAKASVTVTVTSYGDIVVTVPVGTPVWLIVAIALVALLSISLAGIFTVERSKYALLLFLLPLYTRISKDRTLENYNRGRVYEYIELNPGTHYNAILAALDLNNGALVYHLEVLRREGLVTSRQEGMYRRFYPRDMQLPPILENGTTESQLRVLKAIQEMPGITQKELAKFLGLRQSTLAYQLDRLAAMNYIVAEKSGRKVHYTAKQKAT